MTVRIKTLDHLVLTVADLWDSIRFYRDALGMTPVSFLGADGTDRWALSFGAQKINLHQKGQEFEPKARAATPGSADLCFLSDTPLEVWLAHFADHDVTIEAGPVRRTGAAGPIVSLYVRDPDGNLIELSNPVPD